MLRGAARAVPCAEPWGQVGTGIWGGLGAAGCSQSGGVRGEPAGSRRWYEPRDEMRSVVPALACQRLSRSCCHLLSAVCSLPGTWRGAPGAQTQPALLTLLGRIVLNLRNSLPAGNSWSRVMSSPALPFLVLSSSSPQLGAGSSPWPTGSTLQPPSAAVEPRHLLRDEPASVWALLKAEEASNATARSINTNSNTTLSPLLWKGRQCKVFSCQALATYRSRARSLNVQFAVKSDFAPWA